MKTAGASDGKEGKVRPETAGRPDEGGAEGPAPGDIEAEPEPEPSEEERKL